MDRIGSRVHMLRNLDVVFDGLEPSGCCNKSMREWHNEAESISTNLPKFSEYWLCHD
jgi:hypothetical protein